MHSKYKNLYLHKNNILNMDNDVQKKQYANTKELTGRIDLLKQLQSYKKKWFENTK